MAEPNEAGSAQGVLLKRQLNKYQGAALILGCMIGSGIFTNPSKITNDLGGPVPALICWIFGAWIAYFGAMCYAEWTCRIPLSGGDAPFLTAIFGSYGELVSYIYTWCRVFFINPGYAGTAVITFAEYLLIACGFHKKSKEFKQNQFIVSIAAMVIITTILMSSNRISSRVFSAMTICAVLIVSLMAITFPLLLLPQNLIFTNVSRTFSDNFNNAVHPHFGPTSPGKVASSLVHVLWAYDGWSNLASSAGEVLDPQKSIPAAHLIGISLVAVIYFLVNLSIFSIVPFEDLTSETLPVKWIKCLFPDSTAAEPCMAIMIALCTASCCFMTTYSSSRISQAAGVSKRVIFPKFFASLNGILGTPINALLVNLVLTSAFCSLLFTENAFWFMLDFVSYHFWIFCLLTIAGLLHIKYREGSLFRWKNDESLGIRVYFVGPIVLSLTVVFFLVFTFFREKKSDDLNDSKTVNSAAIGVLLLGLVPYYYQVYRPGKLAKEKESSPEIKECNEP